MKQKIIFSLIALLALAGMLVMTIPATAGSGQPQVVYQTPTAQPDGRILYRVKAGDTCISISLLNKISLDDLRRLNGIEGADCPLQTGRDLLLGVIEATPAPLITPTPTSFAPNGTPFTGTGEICISLFDDLNGNGLAEQGEKAIPGGAVSINDRAGKVSLTGQTSDVLE
ncbi:MAG TPA: LysM domain-containing protein, partial [Anaerolineales bacterium]